MNSAVPNGHMEIGFTKLEDTIMDKNTIIEDKIIIIKLEEKIKVLEVKLCKTSPIGDGTGSHTKDYSKNKKREKLFKIRIKHLAKPKYLTITLLCCTVVPLNTLNEKKKNENWLLV